MTNTNGTDEVFDGEAIRYEEDYVVFTVLIDGTEKMIRAVAVDKVASWERIDR